MIDTTRIERYFRKRWIIPRTNINTPNFSLSSKGDTRLDDRDIRDRFTSSKFQFREYDLPKENSQYSYPRFIFRLVFQTQRVSFRFNRIKIEPLVSKGTRPSPRNFERSSLRATLDDAAEYRFSSSNSDIG